MAGKGSKPRNCFSKDFRNNYESINWGAKKIKNSQNETKLNKQENTSSK